jgi:hypothetical protein
MLCPLCGSDRLIALSFPDEAEETLDEAGERRPLAKCVVCGERIYDPDVILQEDPSLN